VIRLKRIRGPWSLNCLFAASTARAIAPIDALPSGHALLVGTRTARWRSATNKDSLRSKVHGGTRPNMRRGQENGQVKRCEGSRLTQVKCASQGDSITRIPKRKAQPAMALESDRACRNHTTRTRVRYSPTEAAAQAFRSSYIFCTPAAPESKTCRAREAGGVGVYSHATRSTRAVELQQNKESTLV
jgi:hypothetical protein